MKSDAQLLREYSQEGAESAFAEIVLRHTNLVYSAALRQVLSPDIATDVTQTVFVALARVAPTLQRKIPENASLAGWLCRSARNISLNIRRDEFRRESRERLAMEQSSPTHDSGLDWERIAPVLDAAMSELKEQDYDALILRFFKNYDLREVGQALGVNDDAAQKRVSRALGKLRETLAKRGISIATGALTVVLSTYGAQAAPVGLALAISSSATIAAAATLQTSAAVTATKIIAMTTLQKTIIGVAFVAAVGTGFYEARQASRLGAEVKNLRQQQGQMADQLQQLQRDLTTSASELATAQEENARLNTLAGSLSRGDPDAQKAGDPVPLAENVPDAERFESTEQDLPKESWGDVGFSTPMKALQTRGWAVSNGNRERFKESVHVTDSARQTLEDMFIKLMEASKDPNKAQFIQQILDHDMAVEDGILMPLMAENRQKSYAGYRILSQESLSADETIVQYEIQMASGPARKETLKFQRIGNDWKVVIDDDFIKAQRQ